MVFPFYFVLLHLSKNEKIALLGAFLGVFSYANVKIAEDLLKNTGGLFFGLFFIYFFLKAFDEKKKKDLLLAGVSFLLMLATHFSSTAYIVVSVFPFLVLFPIFDLIQTKKLTGEAKISLAIALLIVICASILIIIEPGLITDEGIGTLGIQHLRPGQNLINFSIFQNYSFSLLFIIPGLLSLYQSNKKHLILFVSWLIMSFLLMQPVFVEQHWLFRFELMAYLAIIPLLALGAGYFAKNSILFYLCAAILCGFTLYFFYNTAMHTGPLITDSEWQGLLQLKDSVPANATFGGAFGGVGYWIEAAGLSISNDQNATYLIIQKDRNNVQIPSVYVAQFGRFFVITNQMNRPNQPNRPPDKCGDGVCDPFEKKNEFVCPKDCPR
jgi:hypothetical protein